MKAQIVVTGLLLATVGTVLVYPGIRGNATAVPQPPPARIVAPAEAKRVQVVFVLDTTGSMGGLIAAAKEKIWSIASTLAQARQTPDIEMGLVAYRDRGDAYVTRIVDLDKDLDSMYAKLMGFAADGGGDGPESVNQALDDAVNKVAWSTDQSAYKVVFLVGDAPPHMDYANDRKYPEIVAAAAAKGIVVNTIQCGNMSETAAPWRQIAALGHGRYFTVEQAGSAVAVATPYDAEIARLAAEMDGTRLYYGTAEQRAAMAEKIEATDKLHAAASVEAQARRGVFNASAGGAANLTGDRDLVSDAASGRVDVAALPPAALPAPLAKLSTDERKKAVAETGARRAALQQQIAELGRQRDEFIAAKVKDEGGAAGSLDQQIYDAVREQGAKKGLDYEDGPKF